MGNENSEIRKQLAVLSLRKNARTSAWTQEIPTDSSFSLGLGKLMGAVFITASINASDEVFMDNYDPILQSTFSGADVCPSCGSNDVSSQTQVIQFDHGDDSGRIQLNATVPVHKCEVCELEYLSAMAEDIKHVSVCRHLGIYTPLEIVQLRKKNGMSRAKFAELTKIGEATLGRWERGALTQNIAYDQLLYLLQFSENVIRLRQRSSDKNVNSSETIQLPS